MMKKHILIFLLLTILISCSTINKINKPSKLYSNIKINEELSLLRNQNWNKEIISSVKEDLEFRLSKRIEFRNKIIDSLNLSLNKLLIIDFFNHGSAGEFEVNYIFYDSIYIQRNFNVAKFPIENFSSKNVSHLKENSPQNRMILQIYKTFYLNYPIFFQCFKEDDDGKTFFSYEITLLVDNKVSFYKISNSQNCEVYKLERKKLIPIIR